MASCCGYGLIRIVLIENPLPLHLNPQSTYTPNTMLGYCHQHCASWLHQNAESVKKALSSGVTKLNVIYVIHLGMSLTDDCLQVYHHEESVSQSSLHQTQKQKATCLFSISISAKQLSLLPWQIAMCL